MSPSTRLSRRPGIFSGMVQKLTLGHSPDPDDAFMFYGLAKNLIPTGGYEFEHHHTGHDPERPFSNADRDTSSSPRSGPDDRLRDLRALCGHVRRRRAGLPPAPVTPKRARLGLSCELRGHRAPNADRPAVADVPR